MQDQQLLAMFAQSATNILIFGILIGSLFSIAVLAAFDAIKSHRAECAAAEAKTKANAEAAKKKAAVVKKAPVKKAAVRKAPAKKAGAKKAPVKKAAAKKTAAKKKPVAKKNK